MFCNSRLFSIVFPANDFKVDTKKELQWKRLSGGMRMGMFGKTLVFCQNFVPTQVYLKDGAFGLQQQALIATADARFTATCVSVNFSENERSFSVLFFSTKITLDSALQILGGVGNMRDRERGRQEIIHL